MGREDQRREPERPASKRGKAHCKACRHDMEKSGRPLGPPRRIQRTRHLGMPRLPPGSGVGNVGECGREQGLIVGSGFRAQGSSHPACTVCDVTASAIVECAAKVIVIRQGAGLALATRRHVVYWRALSEAHTTGLRVLRRPIVMQSCVYRETEKWNLPTDPSEKALERLPQNRLLCSS